MKPTFQPTEDPKNYDGNVIFLVDSFVRENDFVFHKHKRETRHGKRKFDKERSFFVNGASTPRVFDAQALVTPGCARRFVPDLKLQEILLDGRVKVSILLNTYGGQGIKEVFECFSKTAHKNGGDVDAYVAARAESAGALIFETADSHFSLPHSNLMWHASIYKHPHRKKIREQITDETLENIAFFQKNASQRLMHVVRRLFAEAIVDPSEPYNDVNFTGEDLRHMGIVDRVYFDILELRKQFTRRTGIPVDPLSGLDNPIDDFFYVAEVEEATMDETGIAPKLELDKKREHILWMQPSLECSTQWTRKRIREFVEEYSGLPVEIRDDYR